MFRLRVERVKKVFDIVLDFVIFPILFCTVLFSCIFIVKQGQNIVPSLFDYSFVKILSQSMEADGFYKDDVAVVKQGNREEYQVGEIISFYYSIDHSNPGINNGKRNPNALNIAKERNDKIYFHRIVDKKQDRDGIWWYQTQGSSNKVPDAIWIRNDFVVGNYVKAPSFFVKFIKLISTPKGIILITFIPTAILFLSLLYQMIIFINYASFEKLLVSGQVSIFEEYCIQNKIADNLDEPEKLKIFNNSPVRLRQKYYALLWHSDIMSGKKPTIYNAITFEESLLYSQLPLTTRIATWFKRKLDIIKKKASSIFNKEDDYTVFDNETDEEFGQAVPIKISYEVEDEDIPFLNRKKKLNQTIDFQVIEDILDEGVTDDAEFDQFDSAKLIDLSPKECREQKKIHENFIKKKAVNLWDPNQTIDFKTQETAEILAEEAQGEEVHIRTISEEEKSGENFSDFIQEFSDNKGKKKKRNKHKDKEKPGFAVFESVSDEVSTPFVFYDGENDEN